MGKKKLCFYMDRWANGGMESYVMNLLRNWDVSAISCEILVGQIETERYHQELSALGVPIRAVLGAADRNPVSRVRKTLVAMRNALAGQGYDILYFQMANAVTLYACWVAKRAGIPIRAVHSHCSDISKRRGYYVKLWAHQLCKRLFQKTPTHYMACSDLAAGWLFPKGVALSERCVCIPNGIQVERFRFNPESREAVRQKLGISPKWVLGTVGRCEEQKNQGFLLELMVSLRDSIPDAILLLVGEGHLGNELKCQAEALGVADRVIFHGPSSHVSDLLCAMDMFFLPSLFEGNPLTAIEAQTNGLPCLLSDTITGQAQCTGLVTYLPIDKGVRPWADAVRTAYEDMPIRASKAEEVRAQGYDVAGTAQRVWGLLMKDRNQIPKEKKL